MKRSWIFLVALFLLMAAASYAAARLISSRHPRAPEAAPGFALLQDYLGVTDEQKRALADIDGKFARQRPELRDRMFEARANLVTVLQNPDSTVDQALRAAREFGEAQQAMQANTILYTYELRKHLTPQQREKMVRTMGRGICAMTGGPGMGRGMGGRGKGPCADRGKPLPGGSW
mgnify:CR=1 FL=1